MDGWMEGWVDGWMDRWVGGWVNGWMDEWVAEWWILDGWIEGWNFLIWGSRCSDRGPILPRKSNICLTSWKACALTCTSSSDTQRGLGEDSVC